MGAVRVGFVNQMVRDVYNGRYAQSVATTSADKMTVEQFARELESLRAAALYVPRHGWYSDKKCTRAFFLPRWV